MRTNEERIIAMHQRAADIQNERRARRVLLYQYVGAAVCFAAALVLAVLMPGMSSGMISMGTVGMTASIFSNSSVLGYIVIAVIAFLLGSAVTVFCFRLNKWQKEKEKEAANDRYH